MRFLSGFALLFVIFSQKRTRSHAYFRFFRGIVAFLRIRFRQKARKHNQPKSRQTVQGLLLRFPHKYIR